MRTANFRDDVLWAIAYKNGLDPAVDLMGDEADAYASFINAWVRRLYDVQDWPEWTYTFKYLVPSNHVVPYDETPVPPTGLPTPPVIGRVFKVYLVDPDATGFSPIDTPFKLKPEGIHVGFEHGPNVWIRFIAQTPQYTAREWDTDTTYAKGQLSYSPETGECYKSRSNANTGNDPSFTLQRNLALEMIQEFTPPNPGVPATPQVVEVNAASSAVTIPDPPTAGRVFAITIRQPSTNGPGATIATATHTATGSESLAAILTDLRTQLVADPDLATWTLTVNAAALKLTISAPQAFGISATYTVGIVNYPLTIKQTGSYTPAIPPDDGLPERLKLTLTQADVMPTCQYVMTFVAHDGTQHVATYQSSTIDSSSQILTGIAGAIQAAAAADSFFVDFGILIDDTTSSLTFSKLMDFSLTATLLCEGSPWWEHIAFPFALVDQVVTGAFADSLKEQGQSDKAAPEVQAVPTEQAVRTSSNLAPAKDRLTDQELPDYNRYAR